MKRHIPLLLLLGVVVGAVTGTILDHRAEAARNSGGTYSLPTGNPVVSGTTITSTWANGTLTDIGTELTNSLDRAGRGAMTAPLQHASGTVSAPGITFSAGTADGIYRIGTNDLGLTIASTKRQEWTTTGTAVTGTLSASAGATFTNSTTDGNGVKGTGNGSAGSGVVGLTSGASLTAGKVAGVVGFSSGTLVAGYFESQGSGSAIISAGTTQLGASGNPITASYGLGYTIDFPNTSTGTCSTSTQTLTGVAVGGVCDVSPDAELGGGGHVATWTYCAVTAANTIKVFYCNASGSAFDPGSGAFRVRVWQQP